MNEKWTKSPVGGTVISDTPNREIASPEIQEHEDSAREYYSGYLVAESIPKAEFVDLIAAAPDLLEALERMIEHATSRSPHAIHPSKRFCEICGLNSEAAVHMKSCPVFSAEQAIAKAKGES